MNYKIYAVIGVLGVLGIGLLYSFELSWFDRTMDMPRLVLYALLAGGIVGGLIAWRKIHPDNDLTDRAQIYLLFIVAGFVLAPLLACFLNHSIAIKPAEDLAVEFVEEKAYYASRTPPIKGEVVKPTGYYLFFYYDSKLRRIKNKESHFGAQERGDDIRLPIAKGLLGFSYVSKLD